MTFHSNSLHMERSMGLQSSELGGQISCDQWFSMSTFSQFWVILAVWARKAFCTPAKSLVLCWHILQLRMVCLHYIILGMGSFPMSVANSFCDQPLPKYLDSNTVLIYCPHPVFPNQIFAQQAVSAISSSGSQKLFKLKNGILYLRWP